MTNTPESAESSPVSAADIQRAQRISAEVHRDFPADDDLGSRLRGVQAPRTGAMEVKTGFAFTGILTEVWKAYPSRPVIDSSQTPWTREELDAEIDLWMDAIDRIAHPASYFYPTPREELRDRLNAGLKGEDPGAPINRTYWKGMR